MHEYLDFILDRMAAYTQCGLFSKKERWLSLWPDMQMLQMPDSRWLSLGNSHLVGVSDILTLAALVFLTVLVLYRKLS